MEQIILLKQQEQSGLDPDILEQLYYQLGDRYAEDIVCRALEELAVRLSYTARCHREDRMGDMRKSARSLTKIAEQIGMQGLTKVAADVVDCIDKGDSIGLAATAARLLRMGECSLCEIWDLQGLSI